MELRTVTFTLVLLGAGGAGNASRISIGMLFPGCSAFPIGVFTTCYCGFAVFLVKLYKLKKIRLWSEVSSEVLNNVILLGIFLVIMMSIVVGCVLFVGK